MTVFSDNVFDCYNLMISGLQLLRKLDIPEHFLQASKLSGMKLGTIDQNH